MATFKCGGVAAMAGRGVRSDIKLPRARVSLVSELCTFVLRGGSFTPSALADWYVSRRRASSSYNDFEHRFLEFEQSKPVLGDLTNTQLRKKPPGSRGRALFDTGGGHAADASSNFQRDKSRAANFRGKARFRTANFNPDGSLWYKDSPMESIIREGRREVEDDRQRRIRILEKEKELRSRYSDINDTRPASGSLSRPKRERSKDSQDVASSCGKSIAPSTADPEPLSDITEQMSRNTDGGGIAECGEMTSDATEISPSANRINDMSHVIELHSNRTGSQDVPDLDPRVMFERMCRSAKSKGTTENGEHLQGRSSSEPAAVVIALHEMARAVEAKEGQALREAPYDAASVRAALRGFEGHVHSLTPADLCETMGAVARLGASPTWLPALLSNVARNARSFDGRALSIALLALIDLSPEAASLPEARLAAEALCHALSRRRPEELAGLEPLHTVSLCTALARLRTRAAATMRPALAAFTKHTAVRGTEFIMSDVTAVLSAAVVSGHANRSLLDAVTSWVQLSKMAMRDEDLAALCRAVVCVHPSLKYRLAAEVVQPWIEELCMRPCTSIRSFCTLTAEANEAGLCNPAVRNRVATAFVANGKVVAPRQLSLAVRSLTPVCERPIVLSTLVTEAAVAISSAAAVGFRSEGMLPNELASVVIAFASAGITDEQFWKEIEAAIPLVASRLSAHGTALLITGLALSRQARGSSLLAAVDASRALTHTMCRRDALQILMWWPTFSLELQGHRHAVGFPRELVEAVLRELPMKEQWRAAPEFMASALLWLTSFPRRMHPKARSVDASISGDDQSGGVFRRATTLMMEAILPMLPRILSSLEPASSTLVLTALALTRDTDLWRRVRAKISGGSPEAVNARRVACAAFAEHLATEQHGEVAREMSPQTTALSLQSRVLALGALALDDPGPVAWLGQRLAATSMSPSETATVCWACAELQVHTAAASDRALRAAEAALVVSDLASPRAAVLDVVGLRRLAHAMLRLGGAPTAAALIRRAELVEDHGSCLPDVYSSSAIALALPLSGDKSILTCLEAAAVPTIVRAEGAGDSAMEVRMKRRLFQRLQEFPEYTMPLGSRDRLHDAC
eukprot:TRINITY_DN9386_c0_g1_i1.p1 TRINITY_DN9386_c0_g1~~TRINITY_DN9386_c0_g1_i1.p1  ORF type:complete len:1095 (-),score=124.03 TRINITY_DN9386_c0_g1_i1:543-3827(-)